MPASKNQAEQATRDDKGRFRPGVSGNPSGRPAGASNRLLSMARTAAEEIFPLVVEQARTGDMDAARLVLSIGIPKAKPVAVPLEGLTDMPLPEVRRDMGALAGYLLEAVAAGRIALDDAERLLALAKRAVDLKQLGKPFCVEDFRI